MLRLYPHPCPSKHSQSKTLCQIVLLNFFHPHTKSKTLCHTCSFFTPPFLLYLLLNKQARVGYLDGYHNCKINPQAHKIQKSGKFGLLHLFFFFLGGGRWGGLEGWQTVWLLPCMFLYQNWCKHTQRSMHIYTYTHT